VLGALPGPLRGVVLRSALLEVVSAERLRSLLGLDSADALFEEICRQHLPGTREPEGLRYNPRFREFLLARLAEEQPEGTRALMTRHARALRADGYVEEAADVLVAAGEHAEAESAVEAAAATITGRGDWDKALAWCDALGEAAQARRPRLRGLRIRSLLMSRRQDEVAALVGEMRASGELDRLMAEAPEVAGWAIWALHGEGRWRELAALAPPAGSSRRARAMRHILDVGIGEDPPPEWEPEELDRPQPLHVALESALYYQGRLADVERLVWAAAARGPVTATLAEIYRVAVLRVRGELGDARAVLERAAPRVRASRYIEFWQAVEAELAFAEGDREGGLELIRTARRTSREHGYRVAERAVFAVAEGKMLVRMGATPEALELLEATSAWCRQRGLRCFGEWSDTWLAAALLQLRGHEARAAELLRGAVAGMERARRRLELPAAHVLLAEVAWRAGDEDAHDAAADAARAASVAMGSLGPLLTALEDVPDVLARRIDAAPPDDDAWRGLADARRPSGRSSLGGALVRVRTLGRPAVEVGDPPRPIACPPRGVELAAAIARGGRAGVARADLVERLFEGSGNGPGHLRQLLHRLRRALPAGVDVLSSEGRLTWLPPEAVAVDDLVLEALVARVRREVGEARSEALAAAMTLADRGPYLPGLEGEAAARRRSEIASLVAGARREYAAIQLAAGRAADAADLARRAVGAEPYVEEGWRLLMRSRAELAGPETVVPTYLECIEALEEVGLSPSPRTRELMERLRSP
jgi:DNA-binding SARP family transcriptional activator